MMTLFERMKDFERRIEKLELEADSLTGEVRGQRGAFETLVENWATRLDNATMNPTVNWVEVKLVIEAMHSFGKKREEVKR